MKTIFNSLFLLATTLGVTNKAYSQCSVIISPNPITIECGDSVDLTAIGLEPTPVFIENFNGSALGAGWATSATVLFTNPCQPSLDGTPSAWYGNVPLPRTLTTNGFDVSCGAQVCFDLDFAREQGNLDCEAPDLIDEGVYLQWSTTGGAPWTDIFYFQPDVTNGAYSNWANYCFTIPPGAWSANTSFRWHQPSATSTVHDHWGIDNVIVTPTPCGYWYDWANIPNVPTSTATTDPQTIRVAPTATTTYDVLFTNGIDACNSSVTVNVNPFLVIDATTVDATVCPGNCTVLDIPTSTFCTETNWAEGSDRTTVVTINTFPCVPVGETITAMTLDASFVFATCPSWSTFDIVVNGVTIANDVCSVTAQDLSAYLPITSVQIVSSDANNFADYVKINMTLNITSSGNPAYNYSWTPAGSLNNANIQSPNACPTATTTYTGTLTEATSGCTATNTVTVGVSTLVAAADVNICNGATTTLSATGVSACGGAGSNYSWSPATGLSNATISNPVASPSATTTYTVSYVDGCGCTITEDVIVSVGAPTLPTMTTTPESCDGANDGTATGTANGMTPGYTYLWDDGAAQTTNPATGLADGTYTVTITDALGCSASNSTTVAAGPIITAGITPEANQCLTGNSFTFDNTGTTGVTYAWDFGDAGPGTSALEDPTYTFPAAGTFTVTQTVSSGTCNAQATIDVTINTSNTGTDVQTACDTYTWPLNSTTYTNSTTAPTVTLSNAANCDSVVTLDLTITTFSQGTDVQIACDTYTWPLNTTTYTTSNSNATYTIVNGSVNGCDSIVTLDLTINNSNTGTDVQVACNTYTWPLNLTTYTSNTNTPTVTLINAANCDSVVTLDLTITTFSQGTDVQVACDSYTWPLNTTTYTTSNNTAMFTIPNGSVNGCDSIVLLDLTINTSNTGTDVQAACNSYTWPLNTTTYTSSTNTPTVTLTNAANCDSVVTLDLTITTCVTPTAAYSVSDSNICIGECIDFTDQSTEATTWQWTFTGGSPSSSAAQNPGTICFNATGTYTIKQVVTNTFGSDSTTTQIVVNALPLIVASPDVTIKLGESTTLNAVGMSGLYTWSPPRGLDCPTCVTPTSTPEQTITYTVTVDSNGCIATDDVTVIVDNDIEIVIPNIFTPNGDGSNDIFTIAGTNIESVVVEIYSRWGQKVFGWNNVKGYWDGRTLSGSEASAGTYFYIITVKGIDEVEYLKKGSFTLIR
tara:strand:- start:1512 stop:5150 length:3639 start_codon:yes stop_codon:yes gene_type:complete